MTAAADSANRILDAILEQGAMAGVAIAEEIQRKVRSLSRRRLKPTEFMDRVRAALDRYEPMFSRTLSDTLLASWLAGATEIERESHYHLETLGPPPDLPDEPIAELHDDEPLVRFPAIEAAARDLLERRAMPREEFDRIANDARRAAFTVAHVSNLDTLEAIQKALVEGLQKGDTLKSFRERVSETMEGSALGKASIENIYRTNTATAYTSGLMDVLEEPLVQDEFPFIETVPILDARLTDLCRIVSESGLNGTGIFLLDDPEWARLMPPRHYQCRCGAVPYSVEDAAAKGIQYAREWLVLGHRPAYSGHVPRVDVELDPDWVRYHINAMI